MSKQMTTYEVTAPDGHVLEVTGPAGASQEEVIRQAQLLYKPETTKPSGPDFSNVQSGGSMQEGRTPFNQFFGATLTPGRGREVLNALLNEPTIWGMANPAQLLAGAGKSAMDVVQRGGQAVESVAGLPVSPPRTTATGADPFAATNPVQSFGKTLGDIGMVAAGTGAAGPALASQVVAGTGIGALMSPEHPYVGAAIGGGAPLIPAAVQGVRNLTSTAGAAGKLDTIRNAAKAAGQYPDMTEAAAVVPDAQAVRATGGGPLPEAMRRYMAMQKQIDEMAASGIGPAQPITLEESMKFASNAKRPSFFESTRNTDMMKAQAARFVDALQSANRDVAQRIGMGPLFDEAMKEYAKAKSAQEALEIATKWGKRALIAATLGGIWRSGGQLADKLLSRP